MCLHSIWRTTLRSTILLYEKEIQIILEVEAEHFPLNHNQNRSTELLTEIVEQDAICKLHCVISYVILFEENVHK